MAKSKQTKDEQPTRVPSEEHEHLSRLAAELADYDVRADVIDGESPCLRVSNPSSTCVVEDVVCERREHDHAFIASFGIQLGSSGCLGVTAHKIAWLVGATKE